ncbi:MAG: hypothetical protein A3D31_09100 [Candidatus Fluviicola riflensis]|nr:MAG: hypothetical protein CHH17_13510 [Candidatus Fluviicola riflensis]OGS77165.1 MAG: hypothetical protein A3D31_09100 [Candidatus Fluviicola riflensis]OGS82100.1 MAG: hypothetical protein A2724_18045 [Fluviicola sp. RIFCSPHIGHO2_01_FULL_43_53]OGS87794.1 MAG: hypothetical protein A3E30_15480 [Fluviicola sp. RIFCSPHIGHO2_12_FULL_43_24]
MDKFKRIFFFQLKFLPILGVILYILGAIVYEYEVSKSATNQDGFKTLSKKEFFAKAIKNGVTDFQKVDNYVDMEISENEQYKWRVKYDDEEYELRDSILNQSNSFSIGEESTMREESYYLLAIPAIFLNIALILLFNLVAVLWFFSLYDLMKSEFTENHNKWMWLICLLLVPLVAPSFYWIINGKQKRNGVN